MTTESRESAAPIPRVSYAQNAEDILLDRIFGDHVGTFVDVGACYPTIHNNTYFFYLRGWRGVSIEPLPWLRPAFEEKRPEDLNLSVAAGEAEGEMPFYEVSTSGGLSTLDTKIAEDYRAQGLPVVEHRVPVRTVASLIEEYAIAPPDFLSIDAEGTEVNVIRGVPLDRWRPRVIVVESTWPQTTIPSHEDWEPILLAHGYLFAAFNGVNRFYLRDDLRDMLPRLAVPVSALDDFVRSEVVELEERVRALKEQEVQWLIERGQWRDQCALFDGQRAEFEAQRAEFRRGYDEFEAQRQEFRRGYDDFEAGYASFERSHEEFRRDRDEFQRQRDEFEAQRAEFESQRAEFLRAYAEFEVSYNRFAGDRREWDEQRRGWEDRQRAWEVQHLRWEELRAHWERREAEWQGKQADWRRERAELEGERAELVLRLESCEQDVADWRRVSAAQQEQLLALQRLLRPYRLIDRLGVVTAGYGFARRIKHRKAQ